MTRSNRLGWLVAVMLVMAGLFNFAAVAGCDETEGYGYDYGGGYVPLNEELEQWPSYTWE